MEDKTSYKIIRTIINAILKVILSIVFRLKIVGRENIPKEGGYILCSNHISNWDPVILAVFTHRRICFMAKKELFKTKFVEWFAKVYGVFPVDRGTHDTEALKISLKILKNNDVLGIFPEGTRKGMERNIKVKSGAARIAFKTNKKIIPVGIKGDYKLFSKVVITYGQPIDLSEYKIKKTENEKENATEAIQSVMNSIINLTK